MTGSQVTLLEDGFSLASALTQRHCEKIRDFMQIYGNSQLGQTKESYWEMKEKC
jgi:hypothetical protein